MTGNVVIGASARMRHVFAPTDVDAFVALSGDDNPIHVDDLAARAAGFDGRVVHGLLVASLISRILGTELPGPGTVLLGLDIRFRSPVLVEREVEVAVEVVSIRPDKPVYTLDVSVSTDRVAIEGQAVVIVRPASPP